MNVPLRVSNHYTNKLILNVQFGGKHIRVDMATAPRNDNMRRSSNGVEYDRTRSIFIGNVPFDVEVERLSSLLVRICCESTGPDVLTCRSSCLILFLGYSASHKWGSV